MAFALWNALYTSNCYHCLALSLHLTNMENNSNREHIIFYYTNANEMTTKWCLLSFSIPNCSNFHNFSDIYVQEWITRWIISRKFNKYEQLDQVPKTKRSIFVEKQNMHWTKRFYTEILRYSGSTQLKRDSIHSNKFKLVWWVWSALSLHPGVPCLCPFTLYLWPSIQRDYFAIALQDDQRRDAADSEMFAQFATKNRERTS